jgi:hypothetical protein
MKRTIALLVLLTVAFASFAQESDIFRLGAKLGPNLFFGTGTTESTEYQGSEVAFGFTGGMASELVLIENLSVEVDLMFSWFNFAMDVVSVPDGVKLQYVSFEIPVLVKGRLPLGNGHGFLGAGPDFIFVYGEGDLQVWESEIAFYVDQVFHVGLMGTLGYDLVVGHDTNVTFELRYLRTFGPTSDTNDIQANRFDILFGWSKNF